MSKKSKKKYIVNANKEPAAATVSIKIEGGKGMLPSLPPAVLTIECANATELNLKLREFVDEVMGHYYDAVNGC